MLDSNDISANQRVTSYPLSEIENLDLNSWVLKPVLPARFFRKIRFAQNGCWIWLGARWGLPGYLYGQIRDGEKRRCAHVFAYEVVFGKVAENKELDHLCDNKLCVNPLHLEPVTHQENCRRRSADIYCKRGHLLTPENWYVGARDGKRRCKACYAVRSRRSK